MTVTPPWILAGPVPALTLLGSDDCGWVVTLKDYDPRGITPMVTFATKAEAEAFIVERRARPVQ
jgi:hypothetical protein